MAAGFDVVVAREAKEVIRRLFGWLAFLAGYFIVFSQDPHVALGVGVMFFGYCLFWYGFEPWRPRR